MWACRVVRLDQKGLSSPRWISEGVIARILSRGAVVVCIHTRIGRDDVLALRALRADDAHGILLYGDTLTTLIAASFRVTRFDSRSSCGGRKYEVQPYRKAGMGPGAGFPTSSGGRSVWRPRSGANFDARQPAAFRKRDWPVRVELGR